MWLIFFKCTIKIHVTILICFKERLQAVYFEPRYENYDWNIEYFIYFFILPLKNAGTYIHRLSKFEHQVFLMIITLFKLFSSFRQGNINREGSNMSRIDYNFCSVSFVVRELCISQQKKYFNIFFEVILFSL